MDLKIFTAQSGYITARVEDKNGTTIHLHSMVKPEDESEYFEEIELWGDRIILLGTGLGYHLSKIKGKIPQTSKIILIEYYKELALICKQMLFDNEDIEVITSDTEEPDRVLNTFLKGSLYVQVIKHPASYRVQRVFYDRLMNKSNLPAFKKTADCVLLLYGDFFLQEEIRAALNCCGTKVELFDYRKRMSFYQFQQSIEETIQKCKPEAIYSINMTGFDGNGILSEITYKYGIPVCIWFVDDPRPILLQHQQFIRSNMIAFCWERTFINSLKSSGFVNVVYLPLATSPELFAYKEQIEKITRLGFVGSSMDGEFIAQIRRMFLYNPSFEPVVNYVAQVLSKDSECDIDQLIKETARRENITLPFTDKRNLTWIRSLIIHTASKLKRKTIVQSLRDNGIETFGDAQNWTTLCGSWLKTHPDIDYRTQLADVYRSIQININITSCQMSNGVNQRVFDIPVCGGFVINDYQSDLDELFSPNEMVTYSSIAELKDKINYFQKHESERHLVIRRAYSRILQEHTYINRCKSISDIIRK